ncbi:Angiopoietin-related protein 1,Fibrinogen C domain-containing protein 1-A,Fibrinogen C domain-containing protein 1,Fibrinogen C domain-containing protein 1-B,Ficolin-2,Tenascin,Ficolin-1,Microfibril-associated glycoprotein 4,Angiopoietin-related protein 2 [Mytilus edulis]|uniref:Fibrinogen C-terminal domain-containing protein n=1 Tax=Mytilus edulis TaxID=6550 RepID=A0A8S3QKT6_MYTED|nr:Angiopoietin-related protein 1,Fibrinogen C domain-containing protein 1-A,Fibrinogen C domain-containing protein 1,Fibrinogen C domain-containing protein 1-B,Ficolin-2,Tenascin,Ficolin-1,Microfibril-associated glycoprotein 4,Angiopoietin-related protein 2 [Mytilus edulis]
MCKTFIYGFTLFVLASATTSNSSENVEVRLLDNQNAPLVATLDMTKADERIKQFVSDAIETKMKNIEKTIKSKKFVSDALKVIMTEQEMNLRSQIANFERNLTDQLTNYIDNKVNKTEEEKGNQNIHTMTKQVNYELRVDISDFDGNKAYARYVTFSVGDESTNYRLTVGGCSGNAGDSMIYHNGQAFTTKDRDNDPWTSSTYNNNCGIYSQGAWWYKSCASSNLNGLYLEGGKINVKGMFWNGWMGSSYSMKSSTMMIRRL